MSRRICDRLRHRPMPMIFVLAMALSPSMPAASPPSHQHGKKDPCEFQRRKDPQRCGPRGGGGSGAARGDFNGDGFGDLAVGAPFEDVGSVADAGAVEIIYGSSNGLTATDSSVPAAQFWSQNSSGIADVPETNDRFGIALVAGNFNGDSFSDLAVGVPGEDVVGQDHAGIVQILYGSPAGLSSANDQLIDINALRGPTAQPVTSFGEHMTWADFDGDFFGDLVVSGFSEGVAAVFVLRGSSGGLVSLGEELITEVASGVRLAAGKFNGDRFADLAIGLPQESVNSRERAGAVHVYHGSIFGIFFDLNHPPQH